MHAKPFQSCPTLCDPIYCSLPGSSVHGILQATTGVGCHDLLQGIFPNQGLNLSLLYLTVLARGFFTTSATWEAHLDIVTVSSSYKSFQILKGDFCTYLIVDMHPLIDESLSV